MSVSAIIMLIAAIVIVWGGLAFAIIFLLKHPEGSVPLRDDHGRPVPHPE
ncbi:methionine/alanine import family NSS transporter small subunit [Tessaracoccus sp. OH4464_COT-324]|nr:methionine/alanine import family NSS transporter small subunit [Tessaracoccus sp. OH4464_COT-324]RRD47139.1 methionine/alanine import family NSS transporter small subunit [Tessaracoccus sp. OH4464_COT-324]